MILFKRSRDLESWLSAQKKAGLSIGFVPTMGALHEGHISLIDISKKTTGVTVCSIFVNPTQFNDPKDFQKYPITLEKDITMLEGAGCDALFLPEVTEVYPDGTTGLETYDLGRIEQLLEGRFRPGHFQGVCQVMRRLLGLVNADDLFMGQKDYQQCMVVARLLDLTGIPAKLHPCPIVREPDGLAMSSRNLRLSPDERLIAPAIFQSLTIVKESYHSRDLTDTLSEAKALLEQKGFRIDYIEVADAKTLEPVTGGPELLKDKAVRHKAAVVLVAAFLGEIRLIDNTLLS